MRLENSCVIPVSRKALWDFMMFLPNVGRCLPGVEKMQTIDETHHTGTVAVGIGIVKLRLTGKVTVDLMDGERYAAAMSMEAADKRISGLVKAKMTMELDEVAPNETKLTVHTELNLLGKRGEFGHGLARRKADQVMTEFAGTVAREVREASVTNPGS